MTTRVEYNLPNATIEVKGQMGDGRLVRLNTQGDVAIRTKKKPWEVGQEFYFFKYDHIVETPDFELVADLSDLGTHVFTVKVEEQRVTRTATADFGANVDINLLRKRLGVPQNHTCKINKAKTKATFTWEEEV